MDAGVFVSGSAVGSVFLLMCSRIAHSAVLFKENGVVALVILDRKTVACDDGGSLTT